MKIALAWIPWQWDTTGNAMDQMLVVFDQRNGKWKAVSRLDRTYGTNPRDLKFFRMATKSASNMSATVVGRGDNRANPTGSQRFAIEVLPDGQMRATKRVAVRCQQPCASKRVVQLHPRRSRAEQ